MSDSPLDRLDDPRIKQIPLSRWPAALDRPSVDAQELALRVMTEAALSGTISFSPAAKPFFSASSPVDLL